MVVKMQNDVGHVREIKVGLSWTAFFFGAFPFFFRGMPAQGFIWLIGSIITMGVAGIFLMFQINKMTARHYLNKGYKPVGEGWEYAGTKFGIVV